MHCWLNKIFHWILDIPGQHHSSFKLSCNHMKRHPSTEDTGIWRYMDQVRWSFKLT